MTRKIRIVAWLVLIGLAAYQAYAQRYAIGPDGISYLDLSDGVVTGHWSRLVNLYWSPLYPVLIGVGRLLTGAGPGTEVGVVHAVNLVCFVAMLAGFEYMLIGIMALAARTRGSVLSGSLGAAGAYVLFGTFALTMIPMELTTPDLLNSAAAFLVFGAMLRLHTSSVRRARDAIVLGAALGAGALTKSFMVPWAIVCLGTLAFGLRRRGLGAASLAAIVWLAILLPWTIVLSTAAGRPTFGDTGRLTYAWYVNEHDQPSLGGVPPGALRANTEAILPGVGVPADTVGSDPMWFDPAKWNANVHPHFSFVDQLKMVKVFERFYVQNLTPLLFLLLLVAIAPAGSRRVAWWRGWIVYVPAIAGLAAYAMVIVTTRYVMAFVLAGALTLLATLPIARRVKPMLFLIGLALPVVLEALSPDTILGLSIVAAILGGMLAGVTVPARLRVGWLVATGVAYIITIIVLPPSLPGVVLFGAAILMLVLWRLSSAAVRRQHAVRFAMSAQGSLAFLIAALLLYRLGLRLNQDSDAFARAASPRWGNVPLGIARELQAHAIGPGTRIALIGPHAESYWVRTGRMHIVANVPRNRTEAFWELPRVAQDSLLAAFAAAGATVAIASVGPPTGAPDGSWTPVRYHGWIKTLAPPR